MDYEKAYKEALERARKIKNGEGDWRYSDLIEIGPALTEIFPELRESEDERIRKVIYKLMLGMREEIFTSQDEIVTKEKVLAYLEKQKENPKNADSIPADCVSNAKCEDRWNKTAISLPDTGRDVLAKDALGNYLLASFDGAQWFVSVYDGQDHPVLHTPPILEWCDIPLCHHDVNEIYRKGVRAGIEIANCNEQKEQKPELVQHPPITYTYNSNASRDARLKAALLALLNSDLLKIKEGGYFTKQDLIEWVERIPTDRPAWSEEDIDKMVNERARKSGTTKTEMQFYRQGIEDTLKSLRPSWKPSDQDELMKLKYAGTSTKLD